MDLRDYSLENNKGYRYVLVVIDNFSKFSWTVPLENKNAITLKKFFEKILLSSKRKSKLFDTDRGKEIYNSIFQKLLNSNNNKHFLEIQP